MKFFIVLIFISLNSFALEIGERLNFNIIKILPENLIEINVGVTDQIKEKEQIKIYHNKKFVSRGLCVKVDGSRSYWKLYRVVAPKKFSKGTKYQLKAIPIKDVSWEYIDKTIPEYKEIISAETPLKPEKLETNDESPLEARIYASPVRIESINNYNELHYGLEVTKKNISSLDVKFGLEGFRFSAEDEITAQKFQQSSFKTELYITRKKLIGSVDVFWGADYYTQKQGDVYPYKYQIRLYPFGIKKEIKISKTIPSVAFYYSPILETYEMEELEVATNVLITTSDESLRHMVGASFLLAPYPNFEVENDFKFRPLHELEDAIKIDFDNVDFQNTFVLRYYPTKKFFIDYTNIYSLDRRRELYSNLNEANVIHSLNFNYRL